MSLVTNERIYSAVQQSRGKPESEWYRIAHRVADSYEDDFRDDYIKAINRVKRDIDMASLRTALAGGNLSQIQMAAGIDRLPAVLRGSDSLLEDHMFQAYTATGMAGGEVLADFMDLDFRFNQRDPQSVLFARTQAASLVKNIGDQQREALRVIHAIAQDAGLTVDQQARAIREVVGLRKQHVNAPLNLADDIREGRKSRALSRRLSAADKAQIASRMDAGTVDEAFIRKMTENYSESLLNRRALDIGRTESIRSANHGMRKSWSQAIDDGVLPQTTRRFPIVTPDDRLRITHAQIPSMNPDGVRMNEPYETPFGPMDGPPWETNCRCSEALLFTRGEEPEAIIDVPEDVTTPPPEPEVETPGTEDSPFSPHLNRAEANKLDEVFAGEYASLDDISVTARSEAKDQISLDLSKSVRNDPDFEEAFNDLYGWTTVDNAIDLEGLADFGEIQSRLAADSFRKTTKKVIPFDDLKPFREEMRRAVTSYKNGDIDTNQLFTVMRNFGFEDAVDDIQDELAYKMSSELIGNWAQTSADSHPMAQALQRAAIREFDLPPSAVTDHFGDALEWGPKRMSIPEMEAKHGEFLQRFLRAQYDNTQDWFEAQGIDAVTVYRGMNMGDELPAWVAQGGGTTHVELQPMSSFSSSYDVANHFAGIGDGSVMIAMRVPVEDVIAGARTGFGCLSEGEIVVLGGRKQTFAAAVQDIFDQDISDVDSFWRLVEDAGFGG